MEVLFVQNGPEIFLTPKVGHKEEKVKKHCIRGYEK